MKRSESVAKIADALAKAQAQIRGAAKDRENPHFKAAYADLASVWEACREPLAKNSLSVSQGVDTSEEGVTVTTLLMHSSGEWLESSLTMKPDRAGPQAIGSVTTYARRYALSAMVGVAPDDDDDGEGATNRNGESQDEPRKQAPRQPLPECEHCGNNTNVIVSKPEYGGGFVCLKSKGGCGHKWQTVQRLADEHGLKTGSQIEQEQKGKNGNGKHGAGPNETMTKQREYTNRFDSCAAMSDFSAIRAEWMNEAENVKADKAIIAAGVKAKIRCLLCAPRDELDYASDFAQSVGRIQDDETAESVDLWMASEGTMQLFSDAHWATMQGAMRDWHAKHSQAAGAR